MEIYTHVIPRQQRDAGERLERSFGLNWTPIQEGVKEDAPLFDGFYSVNLAGPTGLEPATSCVTGSSRNTILLARLALFCAVHHVSGSYSGANGPKSDPN
jgi:hypothetical protein